MADGAETVTRYGFLAELKRRRVFRVLVLYAIVGWIVVEVASTVLPALNLPAWTVTLVIVLVALGLPIAMIMAWALDIGPSGVHRAPPADVPAPVVTPVAPAPGPATSVPAASTAGDSIATPQVSASSVQPQRDAESRHTIAVLPFVNMSGDAENEYFSDGISEEILNLLTKLPQLKVSSRTSSFVFKGKEVNIPTVARELGVGNVLEGSVRRAGDQVRITAQLIETDTDSHLWSETYDREMKDVFAIQDDIARSIVEALQVTLSPKERRAIQSVATSNAQAYDFYLRGRRYFHAMSRRDSRHAISMYEHALALDPKYAAAWAGLADAYSEMFRTADASQENAAKAMETSERAVQLDPDSAEAHAALGFALSLNNKNDDAEHHFETAIALNPNLFEAYLFYGRYCSARGSFEKALRLYRQAFEVNPADYNPPIYMALCCNSMDRKDEELEFRRRALSLIEQHLQANPDDVRARYMGAASLAVLERKDQALEWADMALQLGENEPNTLYNVACTFAHLGERDRALELLEQAVGLGWGDRTWLEHDSALASLHGNPRFKALLASLY